MTHTCKSRLAALLLAVALAPAAVCACAAPATGPVLPASTGAPATVTPTRSPNQRDTIQARVPPAIWHTSC